ncbi:MAG: PDZ domain-containing protein, partial [Defluviitaleaceae bacterium]|nr:PDZ domain-containing protein [Defluviitaleaceae bacterium]
IQYGYVRGRAVLGVTIQYGGGNVQIVSVGAGSAAHVAGVLPGDIVLSANGASLTTFADLRVILDASSPGDTMELRIRRNGEDLALSVVLDEHEPALV